jgi:hypothetical protein
MKEANFKMLAVTSVLSGPFDREAVAVLFFRNSEESTLV